MASSALNLNAILSPANLLSKVSATAQAKAQAAATGGTSTTGTVGLTGTSAGTTFLNLLVKELQNQDPTAPMDSTAMVGQMISLNQLDQLISINQVLTTATKASSTAPVSHATQTDSSSQIAQSAALLNSLQNSSASQAAADPHQVLDLSTLNIPFGGK